MFDKCRNTCFSMFVIMLLLLGMMILGGSVYAQGNTRDAVAADINYWRGQLGLPPLKVNETLNQLAQFHADYMVQQSFWGHDVPSNKPAAKCNGVDVRTFTERSKNCINMNSLPFQGPSNEILTSYPTARGATLSWMSSTHGHCTAMLNPSAAWFGTGYAQNPNAGNTDATGYTNNWVAVIWYDVDHPPFANVSQTAIQAFCGCTANNTDETNTRACVTKFKNGELGQTASIPFTVGDYVTEVNRLRAAANLPPVSYRQDLQGIIDVQAPQLLRASNFPDKDAELAKQPGVADTYVVDVVLVENQRLTTAAATAEFSRQYITDPATADFTEIVVGVASTPIYGMGYYVVFVKPDGTVPQPSGQSDTTGTGAVAQPQVTTQQHSLGTLNAGDTIQVQAAEGVNLKLFKSTDRDTVLAQGRAFEFTVPEPGTYGLIAELPVGVTDAGLISKVIPSTTTGSPTSETTRSISTVTTSVSGNIAGMVCQLNKQITDSASGTSLITINSRAQAIVDQTIKADASIQSNMSAVSAALRAAGISHDSQNFMNRAHLEANRAMLTQYSEPLVFFTDAQGGIAVFFLTDQGMVGDLVYTLKDDGTCSAGAAPETLDGDDPVSQLIALANANRTAKFQFSAVMNEYARQYASDDTTPPPMRASMSTLRGESADPQAFVSLYQSQLANESYVSMGVYISGNSYLVILADALPPGEEPVGVPGDVGAPSPEGAGGEAVVSPPTPEAEPAGQLTYPFTATMIFDAPPDLYDAPNGGILFVMEPGESITVLGISDDAQWYQINDSWGNTGWVPAWGVILP